MTEAGKQTEDLTDVLTAISVIAKRLAKNLEEEKVKGGEKNEPDE